MMASKIFWLFLVMLLSISTFGLWMCCFIFISTVSSFVGFAVMSYSGQDIRIYVNFDPNSCTSNERDYFPFFGIPKVVAQMNNPPSCSKIDQRLTGSNEIDGPLREIILNISRDFIHSWYKDVSSNEEFVDGFNEMCKKLINNFSKSSKEVNWISFITQKIVEDFTTHLRLYRHAEVLFRKQKDRNQNIESVFFNLETSMEKNICREKVCTSEENETEYLKCVSDIILYLLLPPDDFNNKILRNFLREVVSCSLLQPLISQFSDPDIINQNLIWLCKDHPVPSKALLSVLRRTDNREELAAFCEITKHEIKVQNSKDSGDKDEMKKYIKSISFVQNIAHQRYERLLGYSKQAETDSAEFYLNFDVTDSIVPDQSRKLVSLPFDVILNNNIALHYFTQYLTNIDAEGYVFFYHNVEGFRTTVELLQADGVCKDGEQSASEKLRLLALQIFDSYLSNNAPSKVNLDESLLKKVQSRIRMEHITENCFEEVQEKVYDILENEFYLTGFKDSKLYIKLLAELDLLNDFTTSSDLDSLSSSRSEEEEKFNCDTVVPTDEEMLNELLTAEIAAEYEFPEISSGPLSIEVKEVGRIFAEVHSTGITHHAGRTFAVYAISVTHQRFDGPEEKWFVVRRYSEFYDFHEIIIRKFPCLRNYNFPAKKPFNNLTRQLMEKRRHMLNDFMQFLLSPDILNVCDGLNLMIYNFLQPNVSEKGKKSFVRSVGTFVNPIKSSVKTVSNIVRLVPDTFLELKDGFVKAFFKNNEIDSSYPISDKPLSTKDPRTDDIPFRIILLLMDEVFNLRNKDLWFRRRIMALLRQIIKTMQGGAINRKIKEYVQGLTSVTQIAEWLKLLSKSIWPDGKLAGPSPERDHNTKMRTRIVAKMLLFCAIPDELKHIIGYETCFKGAMLIFNMFQNPALNRRLLITLFESFLITLFPNNKMTELLQRLHPMSPTLLNMQAASMENINIDVNKEQKHEKEILQNFPENKSEKIINKSSNKLPKESKSKLSLQCLSQQKFSSPKQSRKRKKSLETAIFYTDLQEEDTVILPLNR